MLLGWVSDGGGCAGIFEDSPSVQRLIFDLDWTRGELGLVTSDDRVWDRYNSLLTCSLSACAVVMKREFNYWGLDEISLQPCCALKFYSEMVNCSTQTELDMREKIKEEELIASEKFGDSKLAQIRFFLFV